MSKRFGRNQKRAMRAQIRNHEQEISRLLDIRCSMQLSLDHANGVNKLTAEILGEHFVSLPVKTKEVEQILDRFQHASMMNATYGVTANIVESAILYIDTHQASVRFDELQQKIHMRYSCINGDVAYALSPMAWKRLSHAHLENLIAQQVAPEMARLLTEKMKRLYR